MKLLDRLILKELFGPWAFGVGLFAALLIAATYLGRIAGYVVDGVPGVRILQLTALLLPAILVKTFSMSVLLAALLAFGRLSGDSEIVAVRAGGASIYRIVRPVALFSLGIAVFTFAFNELVVPGAATKSKEIVEEITRSLKPAAAMPVARAEIQKFKLRAFINAENVNPASKVLQGVTVIAYDDTGKKSFLLTAKELEYSDQSRWRVRGGATLASADLGTVVQIPGDIWPDQIPEITQSFSEVTTSGPPDFDAQSMVQMRQTIENARAKGNKTPEQIANYEYGYWNKIALPLAAVIFGTLGSVLGIRNHRTSTASGFALAVAIIFGYFMLANFMNVWAMGGAIPAWVASFSPLFIGSAFALVILFRRNA